MHGPLPVCKHFSLMSHCVIFCYLTIGIIAFNSLLVNINFLKNINILRFSKQKIALDFFHIL